MYLDVRVAASGEHTSEGTDDDGTKGSDGHRSSRTHRDTSSKSGVLDVLHGDAAAGSAPDRGSVSHHASTSEGEVGVHHGEISAWIVFTAGHGVERRPEHPEEDGAHQRENIGMIFAT